MPLPGDTVTYTFTLQNIGDIALDQISVIDSVLGDVSSYFPTRGQRSSGPAQEPRTGLARSAQWVLLGGGRGELPVA